MSGSDGYAWLKSWEQPYEGSLSLLLKFSWANTASASNICQDFFGKNLLPVVNAKRQGRTLLDLSWATTRESELFSYFKTISIQSSLYTLAERWTFAIASDTHIRYCARCITDGFHSGIYQIDALQKCPVHREPLVATCNHCGAATSAYAICSDTFQNPFHCTHCNSHLGNRNFDPKRWDNQLLRSDAESALAPFATWLRRLANADLRWDRWEDWGLPLKHMTSEVERRRATVRVLASLIGPCFNTDLFGSTWSPIPMTFGMKARRISPQTLSSEIKFSDNELKERQFIYRSIRRKLESRFGRLLRDGLGTNQERWKDYVYNNVFFPKNDVCLFSLAVLYWRFRMEDDPPITGGISLRPPALNWPQGGTCDTRAWAGFLMASFQAAVATLSVWSKRANDLIDPDIFGTDRVKARELFAEFAPAFDLAKLPVLPGVSAVEFNIGSERVQVAVFGPPDSVSKHLCGATPCRCVGNFKPETKALKITTTLKHSHAVDHVLPFPAEAGIWQHYIRPLDELILPPELSGASRVRMLPHLKYRLQAADDIEAISAYLGSENFSKSTSNAYRLHIEKCLIWSVAQQHKSISSLTSEDAHAYYLFIENPSPQEIWLNRTNGNRHKKHWSPFKKPLAARSRDFTIGILSNLFDWWENKLYIDANPWRNMSFQFVGKRQNENAPVKSVSSSKGVVSHTDWLYVIQALSQILYPERAISLELALFLSYYESLKPSEIAAIRADSVEFIPVISGEGLWRVPVQSRGSQRRWVYLLPPVVDTLCRAFLVKPEHLTRTLEKIGPRRLISVVGTMFTLPDFNDIEVDSTGFHRYLYSAIKPLFRSASILAATTGDGAAAARLGSSSLDKLSKAYEEHVHVRLRDTTALWHLTGARRMIGAWILQYAHGRDMLPPNKLIEDIRFLAPSFHATYR